MLCQLLSLLLKLPRSGHGGEGGKEGSRLSAAPVALTGGRDDGQRDKGELVCAPRNFCRKALLEEPQHLFVLPLRHKPSDRASLDRQRGGGHRTPAKQLLERASGDELRAASRLPVQDGFDLAGEGEPCGADRLGAAVLECDDGAKLAKHVQTFHRKSSHCLRGVATFLVRSPLGERSSERLNLEKK